MATAHWIGRQRKNHALAASRILKSIPFPRILQPVSRRTHLRSSAMNSPRGGRQAGELISATPSQPSLFTVMVARLDDPDAVAARAVRLGQHGQSDSSVNPPPYLGFVVPPEHPPENGVV